MSSTRARLWIFLGLFGLFALLTVGTVSAALSEDAGESRAHWVGQVAKCTTATLLGPFLGGFSRGWQSCCTSNSWSLFPAAGSMLAAGVAMQFVPLPASRGWQRVRIIAWTVGWLAWFGSGILSLGHALE